MAWPRAAVWPAVAALYPSWGDDPQAGSWAGLPVIAAFPWNPDAPRRGMLSSSPAGMNRTFGILPWPPVAPEDDFAGKLGAWRTVEGGRENTVDSLRKLTGGAGPDTRVECTGRPEAVAAAFEAARKGGRVGIAGEQEQATDCRSASP